MWFVIGPKLAKPKNRQKLKSFLRTAKTLTCLRSSEARQPSLKSLWINIHGAITFNKLDETFGSNQLYSFQSLCQVIIQRSSETTQRRNHPFRFPSNWLRQLFTPKVGCRDRWIRFEPTNRRTPALPMPVSFSGRTAIRRTAQEMAGIRPTDRASIPCALSAQVRRLRSWNYVD
jgi:hypothetical protein